TRDSQLAAARDDRHLDIEQLAAELSPRQAGRDTDLRFCFGHSVAKFCGAQILGQARGRDFYVSIAVGLDHLDRDFAADRSDLALEVANARFTRVMADDSEQGLVRELDVLGL